MDVSDKQVEKYVVLYFQKYGKTIDKTRARNELTSLVCLLEAVYKNINKSNKNI